MNVWLLFPDRDFDAEAALSPQADALTQDLELDVLFDTMADGDAFLRSVAEQAVLNSVPDAATIAHRQQALMDCQQARNVLDRLYTIAVEAIDAERKQFHVHLPRASVTLRQAVETMSLFLAQLRALREVAETRAAVFDSPAFERFFRMLRDELDDDYLAEIDNHLNELRFPYGVLVEARLGPGNRGTNYALRRIPDHRRGRLRRLLSRQPETRAFELHPRDQSGARALDELRDRGLDVAANALGQAVDHVLSFFRQLRTELAFYKGALNLIDALEARGMPVCYPEPAAADTRRYRAHALYDPCLSLTSRAPVVASDLAAGEAALLMITGANQGGKSTFLRGLGVAQLMMQAGLCVAAASFSANLSSGVFTHFRREEDATMTHGKFEEELQRMSGIVDGIGTHALILFNESFSATNEREGSAIAREIVAVLLEKRIKVVFVTHFHELAAAFADQDDVHCLRAERREDGERSFRIVPGRPETTAYGRDLYSRIFSDQDAEANDSAPIGNRNALNVRESAGAD